MLIIKSISCKIFHGTVVSGCFSNNQVEHVRELFILSAYRRLLIRQEGSGSGPIGAGTYIRAASSMRFSRDYRFFMFQLSFFEFPPTRRQVAISAFPRFLSRRASSFLSSRNGSMRKLRAAAHFCEQLASLENNSFRFRFFFRSEYNVFRYFCFKY